MPRDVNGNTQPLPGTIVSTGDTILPSQHNPAMVDLYAMMAQSLSRDGQGGMRAPLDMSGFRIINVGSAVSDNDPVTLAQLKLACPIGKIDDFAGQVAPETWMFCYGQAVSRSAYSELFASLGTVYGVGDGSTTFNLPDLRGRVIAGKDNMGGTPANRLNADIVGATLGAIGGAQAISLIESQMPAHQHGGFTTGAGAHDHRYERGAPGTGSGAGSGSYTGAAGEYATSFVGNHAHDVITDIRGAGSPHTNIQPTIIMNKIIKVSY